MSIFRLTALNFDFVVGPVTQSTSTLQKLARRYRRDVGCLTDLVRCIVIADSPENVEIFLRLLYSMSVVELNDSFGDGGRFVTRVAR